MSCTSSKSSGRWRRPGASASEATNAGSRYVSRNGWASRSGAVSSPHSRLPAGDPADQVVDHVGDERARDPTLDLALARRSRAARERRRRRTRRGRCRRRPSASRPGRRSRRGGATPVDTTPSARRDGVGSRIEIDGGVASAHGRRRYRAVDPRPSIARRASDCARLPRCPCACACTAAPTRRRRRRTSTPPRQLGVAMTNRGIGLVYGGGNVGLMGALADTVLADRRRGDRRDPRAPACGPSWPTPRSTELHVVESMHERKALMAELADAFVALPGGLGTFEEVLRGADVEPARPDRQAGGAVRRRGLLRPDARRCSTPPSTPDSCGPRTGCWPSGRTPSTR